MHFLSHLILRTTLGAVLIICQAKDDDEMIPMPLFGSTDNPGIYEEYQVVKTEDGKGGCVIMAREGYALNGIQGGMLILTKRGSIANIIRTSGKDWNVVIATTP